ncbi:MAG: tRNA preQ1(34) S-adenosylmethionine ribosyltransferase-isomerase QueA [Neomegalonema sp.]|nr:tRNA preQ1(34) S-adenosylmethionine ribosyltransferase-isomerase QueA [Neomegalonema sp.]
MPVELRLSDFDFDLPDELIALRPVSPRRSARMLCVTDEGMLDRSVADLPEILKPGDVLVFNDTKVIPARLFGRRVRGENTVAMEALLIERIDGQSWRAMARPGKRLMIGDRVAFAVDTDHGFWGRIVARDEGGLIEIAFDLSAGDLDAAIARAGVMPLPPYIAGKRPADERDRTDYQTIFAQKDGAVAAPTASLHFDETLLAALQEAGIEQERVTLHVGPGTFLPVKTESLSEHRMHAEKGEITQEAAERLNAARREGRRVIAVGTTALRLLESAVNAQGALEGWRGETSLFITPGFRFQATDLLMTNFHLPRSTLFMLVSAFAGHDRMRAAYAHAIAHRYRFYSYGDSSLLSLKA